MCSADDLQKVLENFSVEILKNLNCVKNILKEHLLLNSICTKFK
jgi:hypothetical protein